MPRCPSCGRRWFKTHPACAKPSPVSPPEPSPLSAVPALPPGYAEARVLGRGGFAVVLRALRIENGAEVAIKIALGPGDDLLALRFEREAAAMEQLGPPAVPKIFERGVSPEGAPFIVMELVAAPTLGDRLDQLAGPMPSAELGLWAEQILDTLALVHARGLVHRDLKPENIFLSDNPPVARLIDFGLVIAADRGQEDYTQNAAPAGTPEYMSPEQCDGAGDIDARSDVYSAGVILFEMLTGQLPFFGSAAEMQEAHRSLRPPRPSGLAPVSPELEAVVLRCLNKDRQERFADARTLAEAFRLAIASSARFETADLPRVQAAAAAPAATTTKRQMGAVFFETARPENEVVATIKSFGGSVAYLAGQRCTAVFDQDAAENPVQRATAAARALVSRGVSKGASVDLIPVTVQERANGARRFLSAQFAKENRYPSATAQKGVTITPAARQVLPAHGEEIESTPTEQHSLADSATSATQSGYTTARQAAAPMVGREDVLLELLELARAGIHDRRPTIATVIAEPGHGKSRLAGELLAQLHLAPWRGQVVEIRAREPVDGDADAVLKDLLSVGLSLPRGATGEAGHAQLRQHLGEALGAELWPAVALVMGWLPPSAPELAGMRAAPGVLRHAAMRAAGEALRRRASKHPVCLLVDDAQFADLTALDALEYATLLEAQVPLWICVLARPAFDAMRPSWGDRAGSSRRFELSTLDPAKAAELCRRLLEPAESVADQAIQRLVERTQGVPLLLVELVRGLKQEGLVQQTAGGEWVVATDELDRMLDLPLVEWMAQRELKALPPELASHARLAAHLGAEFTLAEAEGVMRELDRTAAAAQVPLDPKIGVRRLKDSGLLISRRGSRLSFRHALVRDSVARSTPEALRQAVHEAAFRFYKDTQALPDHERIPRLAHHAALSGHKDTAALLYEELAQKVADRHDYLEAEAMYSRALELLPETDEQRTMRARRGRGVMRTRIGHYESALEDLAKAKDLAEKLGDTEILIDVLVEESKAWDWVSNFQASKERIEEAHRLSGGRGSQAVEARILLGLGRSSWRFYERVEASATLERVRSLAAELGDEGYESLAIALMILGDILPYQNRLTEAEQVFEQLTRLCEAKGDRVYLANAINNRRSIRIAKKDLAGAVADQELYVRIGRELGMSIFDYYGSYNLTELLYQAGELGQAWGKLDHALECEQRHPLIAPRPLSQVLKARMLAFEGRDAEARELLAALRTQIAEDVARGRAATLFPNEQVLFDMVDLATRDATEAEWDELVERSERYSVEQEPIEVWEMRALGMARRGQRARAAQAFLRALQLAEKLPNLMDRRVRKGERALTDQQQPVGA